MGLHRPYRLEAHAQQFDAGAAAAQPALRGLLRAGGAVRRTIEQSEVIIAIAMPAATQAWLFRPMDAELRFGA